MTAGVLVIDVGTSSVRSSIVDAAGQVTATHQVPVLPTTPAPGMVDVDAAAIFDAALHTARAALSSGTPVAGVGIANQRATAVVWERSSGQPVAPAIGWQDLRTVIQCLVLQAEGLRLAPNVSATKFQAILDAVDPDRVRLRSGELCCGTLDTYLAFRLSGGAAFITDATNAAVTGLVDAYEARWDPRVLEVLGLRLEALPEIVDSAGIFAPATLLPGSPMICGLAGDQQASLIGQGCTTPGTAKITFGTGGMLDLVTGDRVAAAQRGEAGTFPIVAYQLRGQPTWGVEAIMLSAGSCIEWLRDDLGLLDDAASSATVAAACADTGGVSFIPALLGLGTPVWDFGARGTLLGLTRGTGRPELVRAVLEGIAQRGADLVDAAETDSGLAPGALRVDGGMSANPVFIQSLADATGRTIELARELEATTLGAGFLAGLGADVFEDLDHIATLATPRAVVAPQVDDDLRGAARARWLELRSRAERTIPELSGVSF